MVEKDTRLPKHPELAVPNLQAMSVMKSLKSRGFVAETFNWQFHYFTLTDEGILFLRSYLHMPETVVPATIAKARRGPVREEGERREQRDGDYRRNNAAGGNAGWRGKQEQTATA